MVANGWSNRQAPFMIVEMSTYKLKPGMRARHEAQSAGLTSLIWVIKASNIRRLHCAGR